MLPNLNKLVKEVIREGLLKRKKDLTVGDLEAENLKIIIALTHNNNNSNKLNNKFNKKDLLVELKY